MSGGRGSAELKLSCYFVTRTLRDSDKNSLQRYDSIEIALSQCDISMKNTAVLAIYWLF